MPLLKEDLIKLAIDKSESALKTAEKNISLNQLEGALNRVYYSIFYAVSALAIKNDFSTSNHLKLMGWFNKKFIYEDKVFAKEMYEIYDDAFTYRQKSDYDITYIPEIDTVNDMLSEAGKFIKEIRNYILLK